MCAVNIGANMQYQSGKCGESGAVALPNHSGLGDRSAVMAAPELMRETPGQALAGAPG